VSLKKLAVDFAGVASLLDSRRRAMDENDRANLIGRLFALMTAKLEDGVGRALDGQSAQIGLSAKIEIAEDLRSVAEELLVLVEAARALCDTLPP
jgi:hypothetical protein